MAISAIIAGTPKGVLTALGLTPPLSADTPTILTAYHVAPRLIMPARIRANARNSQNMHRHSILDYPRTHCPISPSWDNQVPSRSQQRMYTEAYPTSPIVLIQPPQTPNSITNNHRHSIKHHIHHSRPTRVLNYQQDSPKPPLAKMAK